MKHKFLFSFLFICLAAIASFAQTDAPPQPLDVLISAKDRTFFVNDGAWLLKVKITNRADKPLNLKDFCGLHFTFAKTLPVSSYEDALGFYGIDKRTINPGETFEFEADLKKLEWLERKATDSYGTYIPDSETRPPYYPALSGSYTVFALISNCQEVPLGENSSRIEVRNCRSNMLAVKVAVKMDK